MASMSADHSMNTINSLLVVPENKADFQNRVMLLGVELLPLPQDSISNPGNKNVVPQLAKIADTLKPSQNVLPAIEADVLAVLALLFTAGIEKKSPFASQSSMSGENDFGASDSDNTTTAGYNANDPSVKQVFQLTKMESQLSNEMSDLQDQQQQDLAQGNTVAAQKLQQQIDLLQKIQDASMFLSNLDLQHIMATQGAGAENAVEHAGNAMSEQESGQDLFNYDQTASGFANVEAGQLLGVISPD